MNTVSLPDLDPDGRQPVFDAPYTVAVGLAAGETIPEHRHAGQDITFVVHDGELSLTVDGESVTLGAGDAAAFDGDDGVSVHASEDTQALVVFSER
jgi:quercetin dioxygenase-like cupin family protein